VWAVRLHVRACCWRSRGSGVARRWFCRRSHSCFSGVSRMRVWGPLQSRRALR
jgi:hypothetical protein